MVVFVLVYGWFRVSSGLVGQQDRSKDQGTRVQGPKTTRLQAIFCFGLPETFFFCLASHKHTPLKRTHIVKQRMQ